MAIGREVQAAIADGFDEAADFVEVARRLWDSWEDDAEIRDVATGRFIDREKLHYIDFEGRWFSVRGPSIVPRPPQGQPVVTVLAHLTIPYRLGARAADVVYVTPRDEAGAAAIVAEIRAEQRAAGRADDTIHIFGDLVVFLDGTAAAAAARKSRLDETSGEPLASDALIFTGTAAELAWTDCCPLLASGEQAVSRHVPSHRSELGRGHAGEVVVVLDPVDEQLPVRRVARWDGSDHVK
jgi:alkanesulfonate monooxygenase SsuD/methylene tetrahydromethanopterin reductase-like flavin-dependent oxidoreductase (luciferase family)